MQAHTHALQLARNKIYLLVWFNVKSVHINIHISLYPWIYCEEENKFQTASTTEIPSAREYQQT